MPTKAVAPARSTMDRDYLLVIMIPCFVGPDGGHHVDPLWRKDLLGHLPHLRRLTLAAPARPLAEAGDDAVPIDPEPAANVLDFVDLPPCRSTLGALLTLPSALARLWRAIGRVGIVQAHIGGWPISYGWFAVPMARLRGKFVVVNVEATGWGPALRTPWRVAAFARAVAFEGLGRLTLNLAQLVTCTQSGYRRMLLPWRRHRAHVLVATWIDPWAVLDHDRAEDAWDERLAGPSRPLRLVFAGQLTASKGILVLLDAVRMLAGRVPVRLHIYGKGPLRDRCERAAAALGPGAEVEFRGVLAYGPGFFAMLDDHDLAVVPSLTDEQPRVVYDAYARALPVLASDTTGHRECVAPGRTGVLVPPGDAAALAGAIARASARRDELRAMGLAGLDVARDTTHDRMHARRAELIARSVAGGPPPAATRTEDARR